MKRSLIAVGALATSLLASAALASGSVGISGYDMQPTGLPVTTSSLTSATQSATFIPLAGRSFYVTLSGSGIANCQLERMVDGSNWTKLTSTAANTTTQLYNWSLSNGGAISEEVVTYQYGAKFRLNCTAYTSGTVTVSFSQ